MEHHPFRIALLAVAFALAGAGCWQPKTAPPATEESQRPNIAAPSGVWKEYDKAKPLEQSSVQVYVDEDDGKEISLRIPDKWEGKAPSWRPAADDRIDHIRVQYFANSGPEGEFRKQKASDVHTVVHADASNGRYLLLVNHDVLKASILKVIVPDPERPGSAFYFVECRVGYDADRPGLWSACKAAVDSLLYQSIELPSAATSTNP